MRQVDFTEPSERSKALTAERNRKMAISAHAYVRGSTAKFYEWLQSSTRTGLPEGPQAWICGDCHVGNLGPIASAKGTLAVHIRDLDQTVIGNPAHDLVRLGLSLAMAARSSDLPGITTAHMLEHMVEGYETAFSGGDAEADTVPKIVKRLMREAAGRSWKHLADERIEGIEPAIPLGKRFWPLTKAERTAIEELFAEEPVRRLATTLRSRDDDAQLRVLDAAYWRKGCSSLGSLRYAVLAAVGNGKDERHCLMDLKEAVAPATPWARTDEMPSDHAERVVEGARHLSPPLGARMLATKVMGKPIFVRELLPQDMKLEIEQLSCGEATSMAAFLAHVVGQAHRRQMNLADRKRWLNELRKNRSKSLDAPSWLWTSVVDLVALHEAAYLNHCRRYAAADAA